MTVCHLVLHSFVLFVQWIFIVVLELVSHVILANVVKELPTDATMREVTHVGLNSILVIKLSVCGVRTPKQVLDLFDAPLVLFEILVSDSVLPSFAPELVGVSCFSTERPPVFFVVFEQWVLRIVGVYDRRQKCGARNLFFHLVSVLCQVDKHLCRSMSMSNKLNLLLFGVFPDVINRFYQVVRQIKNGELPIISPVWIIVVVTPAVFVASRVSKPHIVALVDELDHGRDFFPNDPAVGRCKESVLKIHNLCIRLRMMSSNPEDGISMTIS